MPDTTPILSALWRASWQAGVLCLLVLALRHTLRDRLPPAWRCRLWGLVFLRLLLPAVPASPLSLFNVVPADPLPSIGWPTLTVVVRQTVAASPLTPTLPTADAPSPAAPGWPAVVLATWLGGASLLLGLTVASHVRFARRVRAGTLTTPPELAALWRAVGGRRPLVVTDAVTSPALFGVARGRLLLPPNLPGRLPVDQLRFVFRHELAHARRGDLAIGWATTLIRCVYWFHPLIWLAVRGRRSDAEAACDDAVTATGDRLAYGRTLLAVAGGRPVPAVGMADARTDLRRRLARVAAGRRPGRGSAVAAAALTIIVGCGTLTTGGRPHVTPTAEPAAAVTVSTRLIRCRPKDVIAQGLSIPVTSGVDVVPLSAGQLADLSVLPAPPSDGQRGINPRVTVRADGRPATIVTTPVPPDAEGQVGLSETLTVDPRTDEGTIPVHIDLTATRRLPAAEAGRVVPPAGAGWSVPPRAEVTRLVQTTFLKPGGSVLLAGRPSWTFADGRPPAEGSETPAVPAELERPWMFVVVTIEMANAGPESRPMAAGDDGRPRAAGPANPLSAAVPQGRPSTGWPVAVTVTPGPGGITYTPVADPAGGPLRIAVSPDPGTPTPDGRGRAIPIPTGTAAATRLVVQPPVTIERP